MRGSKPLEKHGIPGHALVAVWESQRLRADVQMTAVGEESWPKGVTFEEMRAPPKRKHTRGRLSLGSSGGG